MIQSHLILSNSCRLDAQNIPSSEFQALNDLYSSTYGLAWNWQSDEDVFGVKWDFSSSTNNPCVDRWQGINCTFLEPFENYHIESIKLSKYNLHGPLPPTLRDLTELRTLSLPSNTLTSTLPHSIGDLPHLRYLDLSMNAISSSISSTLGNLSELTGLYLYNNLLSHTLPYQLGRLSRLRDLYVEQNDLTGTIPESIGYITTLVNLDLYNNSFTGRLPDSLQYLVSLTFLGLDTNYLSGTMPTYLSQYVQLLDLDMNNNMFTGTLPPALSQMPSLQFLRVHTNYFTGTIPATLVNLTQLKYLELNQNLLTGTIPHTLSEMTQLSLLMLQSNKLEGNLYNLVNVTTQTALANIQLNNNQLTGTLPDSLFQLKSLNTLVLVSNCFSGTLPASMCNPDSRMYSIVLDGLSSATSCQYKLLLGLSDAYTLKQAVHGHIPLCVFSLPNLTTLHLSGNSLTGSLPNSLNINSGLIDLILSHNLLTNTIPRVIQERVWYNLDLSYNRLSGTLKNTFASIYPNLTTSQYSRLYQLMLSNVSTPSLQLVNNRLSGHVPGNILNIRDISILGNNVFSCNIDGSDLPPHDNNRYNYQCGSTEFEVPFYIWLGMCIAVLCTVILLWSLRSQLQQYIPVEYAVQKVVRYLEYSKHNAVGKSILIEFYSLLDMLCWLTYVCTIFTVVVLLPVYGILSQYYGTMTHEYAWILSAAFVSGRAPFGLEFFLWIVMLCVVLLTFARLIRETQLIALRKQIRSREMTLHDTSRSDTDMIGDTNRSTYVYIRDVLKQSENITNNTLSKTYAKLSTHYKKILIYLCYALVNLLVVIGANVMYVYVAIYEDADFLIFAQIILSIFKLAWNNALRERTLKLIAEYIIHSDSYIFVEKDFASLQIFISLVNNIAIPCCVVAVVSPRCFYNVFVAAPPVSAHFTYQSCNVDPMSGYCVLSAAHRTTSYSPPYTYNYQCSSSLITYYAPAFASLCIISTFVIPGLQVLALALYKRATPGSLGQKVAQSFVPVLMLPLPAVETTITQNPLTQGNPTTTVTVTAAPGDGLTSRNSTTGNNTGTASNGTITTYFAANPTLCALLTDLALLLTYGVVFPPLAVALALAIIVSALFAKVKIGRFITNAIKVHTYKADSFINVIINDCEGVGSAPVLRKTMWMLITASCWFYTLFLFDTLGDAVGFHRAVWVLIVMPLMPLVLYITYYICARCTPPATLPPPSPGNRDSSIYSVGPPSVHTTMPSMFTSMRGPVSTMSSQKTAVSGSSKENKDNMDKNASRV